MHAFPVTVIDSDGHRRQFDQLATSLRDAERLVLEKLGEVLYLFVRRATR
jgi:hypothetical protein